MPQTVYLTRHATPDRFRAGFIYHQLPGPPLTEQGVQEAHALGRYLQSCGVRWIYASPFERCRRTAEIAAEVAGIPWQVEADLGELQPGDTHELILERVEPIFERICREGEERGPAVLVTHGGVVGALLQHLGMDSDLLAQHKTYDYGNPLPPAGAWLAERAEGEPGWKLSMAFHPEIAPSPV